MSNWCERSVTITNFLVHVLIQEYLTRVTWLVQVVKEELLFLLEHLGGIHVAQHDWYKWWNKNCLLFWSTCVGFMLLNTTGISGETRTAYSSGALGWGSCCSTRLVQVVKEELLTLLEHLCRVHVTQSLVFWVVFGVWVLVFFVLFLLALVFSVLPSMSSNDPLWYLLTFLTVI
jgi:hypothetical protein